MELIPYVFVGLTSSGFGYFCYRKWKHWSNWKRRYPLVQFEKGALFDDADVECGLVHPTASDALLAKPDTSSCRDFSDSIMDDGRALILAANFCRNSNTYVWKERPLLHIGSSNMKRHFLIDCVSKPTDQKKKSSFFPVYSKKNDLLMTLVKSSSNFLQLGLDQEPYMNCLHSLVTSLRNHPFLLSIHDVNYLQSNASMDSLIFVTDFIKKGSLKDLIYGVKPDQFYEKKYQNFQGNPLSLRSIARYGWQILEGLLALKKMGLPFYHLHSGNVLIEKGVAKLANYENMFILLEENIQLREMVIPLEEYVDVEVILFGHLLYEMAYGVEIKSCCCFDGAPDYVGMRKTYPEVQEVLDFIFVIERLEGEEVETTPKKIEIEDVLKLGLFQNDNKMEISDAKISLTPEGNKYIENVVRFYKRRHRMELSKYQIERKKKELEKERKRAANCIAEQDLIKSLGSSNAQQRRMTYATSSRKGSYRYSQQKKTLQERLQDPIQLEMEEDNNVIDIGTLLGEN